jgi:acyl-CoA thioester hydrolase
VRIAGEESVIATIETVYVLVTAHTLVKMPLPADFRATLEKGAPGKTIDHAGYTSAPSK